MDNFQTSLSSDLAKYFTAFKNSLSSTVILALNYFYNALIENKFS